MFEDGNIIWATRRNRHIETETFISENTEIEYNPMAKYYLSLNITPLFEWCHDVIRVGVLYYPKKELVLLALRNNETGQYLNINDKNEIETINKFKIPVVKSYKIDTSSIENIKELFLNIKESVNMEGIVITIENGTKYKFKSNWYISMCYAQKFGEYFLPQMLKLNSNIKSIPIDKIWFSAIMNIDDVISSTISLLNDEDSIEFNKFVHIVQKNIERLKTDLHHWFIESFDLISNKEVILQVGIKSGWDIKIMEKLVDNKNNWADQEHYKSVTFIGENLNPCPILQLPADTYLLPQGALDKALRFYWTNLIPYIVLPEFNWTSATYTDSYGWTNVIEKLPIEIQPQDLTSLSKDYCAIYFDKDFSQYQIDRQAGLKGTIGLWPGLRISPELIPDYEDTRFSIYLIKGK
jgi:hypothetical protein